MKWLRRIWWALVIRRIVLGKVEEMGIVAYPTILWIELGGGKEIYINKGTEAFLDAVEKKAIDILDTLVKELTPDHLRPIEEREGSITRNIAAMRAIRDRELKEEQEKLALVDRMDKNAQFD